MVVYTNVIYPLQNKYFLNSNWELELDKPWVLWFGIVLFMGLYLPIFYFISGYGFWRHDDIQYLDSSGWLLKNEGRWLSYLFFDLNKKIPAQLAWYINFISMFWFFYSAALRFFRQQGYALIVASACLASPGLYAQLNWPVTNIPAVLLLAISVPLSRKFSFFLVLPLLGILLFGVAPNFYYFLPMLYIGYYFEDVREALIWWVKLLATWVGSFILGYMVANLVVLWKLGERIQPVGWRHLRPVVDLTSLLENTLRNTETFARHFSDLFPIPTIIIVCLCIGAIWCAFPSHGYAKTRWIMPIIAIIVGIIIGIAHYVAAIPLGISIVHRTVVALYVGVIYGLFALSLSLNRIAITLVILLGIVIPTWLISVQNIACYATLTRHMRDDVINNLPVHANKLSGAIIDTRKFGNYYRRVNHDIHNYYSVFDEGLSEPFRWVRAVTAAGISKTLLCGFKNKDNKICNNVFDTVDAGICTNNPHSICVVGFTSKNEIILRLQP